MILIQKEEKPERVFLPQVAVTKEFEQQIKSALKNAGITYASAVRQLFTQYLNEEEINGNRKGDN